MFIEVRDEQFPDNEGLVNTDHIVHIIKRPDGKAVIQLSNNKTFVTVDEFNVLYATLP